MTPEPCDYCDHTDTWHDTTACHWAQVVRDGTVCCDCREFVRRLCDVCAGYGCADCYDERR